MLRILRVDESAHDGDLSLVGTVDMQLDSVDSVVEQLTIRISNDSLRSPQRLIIEWERTRASVEIAR
jgi:hypothetical protein